MQPAVKVSRLEAKEMTEPSLEELQTELQCLRDLIVSLSATLLRTIAKHSEKGRRASTRSDAECLMLEADECFRCAKIPGLKQEIADGLVVVGQQLMAKAVEIETKLQRSKWEK